MSLKDLYPNEETKEEAKKLLDIEYLKQKSIWWWGEQILTLLFLIFIINVSWAITDYKLAIQRQVNKESCLSLLRDPPAFINGSKMMFPKIINMSESEEELPEGVRKFYKNDSTRNGGLSEP